tara:strand:- start:49 stop:900 length:852 start_codon:yes stop_codon:yes gene_type:complete
MNPNQQTIINGVVVEDYEWTIYYHKLLKASKQFKQPETASEELPCVVCANNLAIAKLLLEKYNTNMLPPMPPVLQPLVMPSPPTELSPEAQEFVPEPEPEVISDDDIDFDADIDRAPSLADISVSHIFAHQEPVGVEETKGDDAESVCSDITDETPVKIVNKWEDKGDVKIINDRWKKSKKYYIAHVKNGSSGGAKTDKPTEIVWGWKATRASTDPIIGAVRIVKKNLHSVNIRYRHQHDGQTEKRCVRVRNTKDGFGDYIPVGKGNRIYMRQREGGGGLEAE